MMTRAMGSASGWRCMLAMGMLWAVGSSGCGGDDGTGGTGDAPTEVEGAEAIEDAFDDEGKIDLDALAAAVGVEPGALAPEPGAGPDGVITAREGVVEVRRVGDETFVAASGDKVGLWAGDQVRTSGSRAVITLVDETVVELAADSALAMGDRDASADPASSVAMLYGIARFSVAARAEAEGPFLVFTASGVIGTLGTTYGVGVAATGQVRVGVEDGSVEVVGSAELDTPITVEEGSAATVSFEGEVEDPEPFESDDWGDWRDTTESEADPAELAELHLEYVDDVASDIDEAYEELGDLSADVAVEIEEAEGYAEAEDAEGYEESAEDRAAAIEAAYLATLRLQMLTYAMLSRAYIAHELYLRHPKEVEPVYAEAAPYVPGALLYHKKYHTVVHHHVRPMRPAYYEHHPRGRKHAVVVEHPVPTFYADVSLKPLPPGLAKKRVGVAVYSPPIVVHRGHPKHVWVTSPTPGWHTTVVVAPHPYRGPTWYVHPGKPKAHLLVGVEPVGVPVAVFGTVTPVPRGKAHVVFGHPGHGVKIKGGGKHMKVKGPGGPHLKVKGPGPDFGHVKVKGHGPDIGHVKVKGHGPDIGHVKVKGPGPGHVKVKGHGGSSIKMKGHGGGIKVKSKGGGGKGGHSFKGKKK